MKNPFTVGQWVIGERFFGRIPLIQDLLGAKEQCLWVMAQRRMGKTSLLRQMERESQKQDSPFFGFFWDIQGSFDEDGLNESLWDAVEDSKFEFPEFWSSLTDLPEMTNAAQWIKSFSRLMGQQGKALLLLVDEAEELITLNQQSPQIVMKLKQAFHSARNLKTVMASTPRLQQLTGNELADTSPFLHAFRPFFLSPFTPEEVQDLCLSGNLDQSDAVFQWSGGQPLETQLICRELFEGKPLSLVLEEMEHHISLKQVHDVNFSLLTESQQAFLSALASDLGPEEPDRPALQELLDLGYLRKKPDRGLTFASLLFQRWVERQIGESPRSPGFEVSRVEKGLPLSQLSRPLLFSQSLNLYQFLFAHVQKASASLANPEDAITFDENMQRFTLQENRVQNSEALHDALPWQQALQTLALVFARRSDHQAHWLCAQIWQAAQNQTLWEEAELLDHLNLLAEEGQLQQSLCDPPGGESLTR